MVKASPFAGFTDGESTALVAAALGAETFCGDVCAGADFAGVCALAAGMISITATKQLTHIAE